MDQHPRFGLGNGYPSGATTLKNQLLAVPLVSISGRDGDDAIYPGRSTPQLLHNSRVGVLYLCHAPFKRRGNMI